MTTTYPLIGELASLGAAFSWAISVCTYRAWSGSLPSFTLNLLKNTVALILLGAMLVFLRPEFPMGYSTLWPLALSGFIGISVGDSAGFAALRRLGAQVSAIGLCLGPPVATIAGYFILGEALTLWEFVGVTVTTIGVLGTVYHGSRGRTREVAAGIVFLLISGLCQGLAAVLSRQGMQATDAFTGTFLRLLAANVALAAFWATGRAPKLRGSFSGRRQVMVLAGAASIGTFLGLSLMSVALKYTKAGVATAIMSTYPIWVIPIAVRLLGEKTDARSIAFTVLAAAGVILLVLR